ncbi:hypothetical protein [Winogradskya humida]|uniref:hypothetical protein n=1 Tax=Winogradskya humida TaxID=113566 RepID=UPI001942A4CA|nr:hypothetical protein [Actinoplanes humidus]
MVHHQGDVYRSTTASLPFLFEFAVDPGTPGRAGIIGLLVSIGREAVARAEPGDGEEFGPLNYAGAAAVVRARAEVFGGFVAEADPEVRRAGIPALALFFDDGERAAVMPRRMPPLGSLRLFTVSGLPPRTGWFRSCWGCCGRWRRPRSRPLSGRRLPVGSLRRVAGHRRRSWLLLRNSPGTIRCTHRRRGC